jgi:tripartite-type tricarboxylate transporter receptor subunit TctC
MSKILTMITAGLFAAVATVAALPAMADDSYPNRPVTFLVPYAAGANGDIVARIVAEDLQTRLGQPVIIDNRPGAGGNIGAAEAKRAEPDGYTIMLSTNTHTINQNLYEDAGFDLDADFDAVSQLSTTNMLLLVNPEVPAEDLAAFVELAKAQDLSYSSGGNGASGHLYMELFKLIADIDVAHIPYGGVAAGLTDLIAHRVDATVSSVSSTNEMVKAGQLRPLAVAAPERIAVMPDVPTFKEAGYEGLDFGTWQGVMAPLGTPPEIIAKLNAAIAKTLAAPAVQEKLSSQGVNAALSSPDAFEAFIAEDIARWGKVIAEANITIE